MADRSHHFALFLLTAALLASFITPTLTAAGSYDSSKKQKSPPQHPPSLQADVNVDRKSPSSAVFPVYGDVYPHGLYFAAMSIGDPPMPYYLDVDTGSDLTWLQCDAPCVSCSKGPHPLYRPRKNGLVACKNQLCVSLHASIHQNPECESLDQCDYEIQYADHLSSLGVLVADAVTLRLTNTSLVRPQLAIGCGYDQQGSGVTKPSPTDGVLGLGSGPSSIISQLRDKGVIRNVIGHCLGRRGSGYLFLGDDLVPSHGVTWAPMSRSTFKNYYSPGKASFLFGKQSLGVEDQPVVLDSGSSYTYFANQPYEAFLSALRNDLNKKPLKETTDPSLPVCWKGSKPFKSLADVKKSFTSLTLSFLNGRRTVQMEIPAENYLIISKYGNACLGILNGAEVGLKDLNLIGDISLQDLMVIYDNEKQQIGWAPTSCGRLPIADGIEKGHPTPQFITGFGLSAEVCPASFS